MATSSTAALDQWFLENSARGCTPEQLRTSMLEAGYQEEFANAYLRQRHPRDAVNPGDPVHHRAEVPDTPALRAWWQRADELAGSNQVHLGDRVAQIIGRHAHNGVYYLRNILSHEECDAIIRLASARIEASTVVDPHSGESVPDSRRTSKGTFLAARASPVTSTLESRLALLSGLPEKHGEGLQILHYREGGEYQPHFDYFDPLVAGSTRQLARGGQRLVTIIVYLNEVRCGGGTTFPSLGLEFLPEKGAALMFASLTRDGGLQPQSLHGGAPVTAGEKWIATRWIRVRPFA